MMIRYFPYKLRETAKPLPWKFPTMGQIDMYYWDHCDHRRTEVPHSEITAWYAEQGWAFEKYEREREE